VVTRLLRREPPVVDQRLDPGVVLGDLLDPPVAQQVAAGVTDVDEAEPSARAQQRGERRAHPVERRVALDHGAEVFVGLGDRAREPVEQVGPGRVLVERGERRHDHRRGDLAGDRAADAVGDDEQPWPGVRGVLVAFAEQPDVGAGGVAQRECHRLAYFRSSTTVLPTRIGTPRGAGIGALTFCRSR
jgi:hypothetical protein